MNRFLAIFVTLAWSLWFGGMIALFLFVIRLFAADLGLQAAPVLFRTFEMYQLVIGAISLIAALGWYYANRSKWKVGLLTALLLSGILAVLLTTLVTPRMEELRVSGQSKGDEFKMLHKRSERLFVGQALLLLFGGIAIGMESQFKRSNG